MGFKKTIRSVLVMVTFFGLISFVAATVPALSGRASAASAQCAIQTNSHNDYAGLVAQVQYKDDNGAYQNALGNSMDVNINTLGTINSPPGNVVEATGAQIGLNNNTITRRLPSQSFRSFVETRSGSDCPAGSTNSAVILRGDGSAGSRSITYGTTDWVLDCDFTKQGFYQAFRVTPQGVPSGARSGGTWTPASTDIQPPNGSSVRILFTYIQPADWTLTSASTVSSPTVLRTTNIQATPGTTVKFYHDINNAGPTTAKYQWKIQKSYAGAPWSDLTGPSNATVAKGAQGPGPSTNTLVVPNNPGKNYCQRIYYSLSTGPGSADSYSSRSCVTVKAPGNNMPSGTLTLTCTSTTSGTAKGVFADLDGATSAYITVSGVTQAPTATTSPYTWNVTISPAGGSVPVILYVKDVGPSGSGLYKNVASGTLTACSGPATPCPAQPAENTKPPITLPQAPLPAAPDTEGQPAPSGTTSGSTDTYYQETPGKYQINSAADQYGTAITWTPTGYQSSPDFTLDYKNYIQQYPYDLHDTTVGYTQQYSQQKWVADSANPNHNCPSGGSYSGGNCKYSAPYTYSCPAGQYNSGSNCYDNSTSVLKGAATKNYYCNAPATLSGTTCSYGATIDYNWKKSGGATGTSSTTTYTGAPRLDECYYRQFSVDAAPATNVSNVSYDAEDPDSVSSFGVVSVTFARDPAEPNGVTSLHKQNVVNIDYTAKYYYKNPDGSTGPLPNCSNTGSTVTVSSPSFSNANTNTPLYTCGPSGTPYAPPVQPGGQICADFTFSPTGTSINQSGSGTPQSSDGGSLTVTNCGPSLSNLPYVHFMGADVSAGGSFAAGNDNCSSSAPLAGGILAFVKGNGPLTRGSGTQFAALAEGSINSSFGSGAIPGFASVSLRSGTPQGTYGLTFSNSSPGSYGNLGTQPCLPDYFSTLPVAFSTSLPNGTVSGAYKVSGSTTLNGMTVTQGTKIALYVNGDLNITAPITFAGSSTWSQSTDVPSLYIIATGNIYIDPSVTTLDGVYIAQSNTPGKGEIDTCSSGFSPYATSQLFSSCGTQLTVNGSFIARKIRLHRTFASLRNSLGGEVPDPATTPSCDQNGDSGGARTSQSFDCAAEVFNFSPETVLGQPATAQTGGPAFGKFDYITSLSPVL